MSRIVIAIVIIYPVIAAIGGAAALLATLWAYNTDARMVSDTVTAAVINTAAVVAASGFVGGFEMILSLWQFMRNQEAEQARQQERLEDRKAMREERAEFMAQLREERERNAVLAAKVLELSELAINRAAADSNGGGNGSGNGGGAAGEPVRQPPANHSV